MAAAYWNWKQNFARPGVFPGSFLVFWMMGRGHRPLMEFALRQFALPERGRVLDVGCGGGHFIRIMSRMAPGAHFTGVDYSPVSVRKSRAVNRRGIRAGRVEIVEGGVSRLPFPPESFDLATASETLYFWPDPAGDVKEIVRVLKPGGLLAVACDSADKEAARKYTDRIRGMTVYSPEETAGLFRGAGLEQIRVCLDPSGMLCVTGRKPAPPRP